MTPMESSEAKRELRERMRSARAAIPPSDRAVLSARVEARLLALPELRGAKTVLLFYSFGTEIPTAVLVRRLRASARQRQELVAHVDERHLPAAAPQRQRTEDRLPEVKRLVDVVHLERDVVHAHEPRHACSVDARPWTTGTPDARTV